MSTPLPGWTGPDSPFHAGEIAIQERAGTRAQSDAIGRRIIRNFLPEQHRQFYAQLPFMLVGSVDADGQPWASLLVGPPGFMSTPDPARLRVEARALPGDPLGAALRAGARLGMLGIELPTRRRNRLNGVVRQVDDDGFTLHVTQAFGNCPQYIQGREPRFVSELGPLQVRESDQLAPDDRALIGAADTLFIASANLESGLDEDSPARGADVSHRGGRAGFVRFEDERTMVLPDFTGNTLYQTLGNLHQDPRAGLLFIDFASGDMLQLACTASIVWEGPELDAFVGAERLLRLRVERVRRSVNSLPLRWSAPVYSPLVARTGSWQQVDTTLQARRMADSWRPYRIAQVVDESAQIRSFLLEPAGGQGVPPHEAGQFLPVRLPAAAGGLQRAYTLSAAANGRDLRISVKRHGRASGWLHDVGAGSVIEALGPRGDFTFDLRSPRPAVLLSAGVGITPMIAMLDAILVNDDRSRFPGEIYFIHGARNAREQSFYDYLCAKQSRHRNLSVHLVHSRPEGAMSNASVTLHSGRLDLAMLKRILPFGDFDFYLCGPQRFQQELYDGLRQLRIPDAQIRCESFGSGMPVRHDDRIGLPKAAVELADLTAAAPVPVLFQRSGISATWRPQDGSLLELAEAHGLAPPSGCRAGNCGSCATPLLAGRAGYLASPQAQPGDGMVLPCICVPLPDGGQAGMVLDL